MSKSFVTFKNKHLLLDIEGFLKSPEGRASLEAVMRASRHFDTPVPHPETVCDECKGENPTPWVAPNDLWNQVVGSPNGILCPSCFIKLAKRKGVDKIWDVIPRE